MNPLTTRPLHSSTGTRIAPLRSMQTAQLSVFALPLAQWLLAAFCFSLAPRAHAQSQPLVEPTAQNGQLEAFLEWSVNSGIGPSPTEVLTSPEIEDFLQDYELHSSALDLGGMDSGGGDSTALDFTAQALEALEYLRLKPLPKVDLEKLLRDLKNIRVVSVPTLSKDRFEVSAVNLPKSKVIVVSQARWSALKDPVQKQRLALHEYLAFQTQDDQAYEISSTYRRSSVPGNSLRIVKLVPGTEYAIAWGIPGRKLDFRFIDENDIAWKLWESNKDRIRFFLINATTKEVISLIPKTEYESLIHEVGLTNPEILTAEYFLEQSNNPNTKISQWIDSVRKAHMTGHNTTPEEVLADPITLSMLGIHTVEKADYLGRVDPAGIIEPGTIEATYLISILPSSTYYGGRYYVWEGYSVKCNYYREAAALPEIKCETPAPIAH